ncbi:MAG: fumarate hydratase [Candidatus Gastranaerophilaceae bacterium]
MTIINCNLVEDTVYKLCKQAAEELSNTSYDKILVQYKKNKSKKLGLILNNAHKADLTKRPLCQDTGTVHIFLEIGNEISFSSDLYSAINEGVKKAYIENFYRKSIIENSFLSAKNTETNTPTLINTDFVSGNQLKIMVLLKGAGCDNVTELKMFNPSLTTEELIEYEVKLISERAKNACPPSFVSIAIGTSAADSVKTAEKAYFSSNCDLPEISEKILDCVNKNANNYENYLAADIKITLKPHHMASIPVATVFNCHSLRKSMAIIKNNSVEFLDIVPKYQQIQSGKSDYKEVFTYDVDALKSLQEGENILLSGEILIARDAAHKKMLEYKNTGKKLPFEIKDKIIFYAAPCPPNKSEIVGPIGPTTAHRMDKYLKEFPEIAATIGKGERSETAKEIIKNNNSVYFQADGGIATLLASCIEDYKIIAFEELSTEAVSWAKINKLPLKVAISPNKKEST